MKIDSIITQAVAGVGKGLHQARLVSAQLATGAPKEEEEVEQVKKASTQNPVGVEKAVDVDLGKTLDEQA